MRIDVTAVRAWWAGRSLREQRLLGVLAVIAAGMLAWYGVLAPLRALEAAAAERLTLAVAASAQVEANARDIAGLEKAGVVRADRRPVEQLVLETAAAGGVAVSRQREEGGALTVWIDAVEPKALFAWLGALQDAHGLTAESVTVLKADDGALQAEATFAGATQ